MPKSFELITSDLSLSFDNEAGTLHVNQYKKPFSSFFDHRKEVVIFTNHKDWRESHFSKMVTSPYHEDMIDWFWFDVETKMAL